MRISDPSSSGAPSRGRWGLWEVRREEWGTALGFAAYFFLVIAAFWVMKPLRTSQFLGVLGAKHLPWARFVTAMLMLPVGAGMAFLSARVRHDRLLAGTAAFFGAGNLVFWWLDPRVEPAWIHVPFYFYVDIYVTASVALFWAYLHESMTAESAKRLYALIGTGGLLGGILGSSLAGFLAEAVRGRNLLLLTAATTAATFPVLGLLRRRRRPAGGGAGAGEAGAEGRAGSARAAWDGAGMALRSRYLRLILLLVFCYEVSSVLADFQFSLRVGEAFAGAAQADARTAFLGRFSFWTGLGGLAVQLLATSAVQRRWGMATALSVLPAAMLLGAGAFAAVPGLLGAGLWFGADATLNYGIWQTSREALYAPTPVAAKYRAKAFIDVFGNRFAKAAGAALVWGLSALVLSPPLWAAAAGLLLLVWLAAARAAGRRFERGPEGVDIPPSSW